MWLNSKRSLNTRLTSKPFMLAFNNWPEFAGEFLHLEFESETNSRRQRQQRRGPLPPTAEKVLLRWTLIWTRGGLKQTAQQGFFHSVFLIPCGLKYSFYLCSNHKTNEDHLSGSLQSIQFSSKLAVAKTQKTYYVPVHLICRLCRRAFWDNPILTFPFWIGRGVSSPLQNP